MTQKGKIPRLPQACREPVAPGSGVTGRISALSRISWPERGSKNGTRPRWSVFMILPAMILPFPSAFTPSPEQAPPPPRPEGPGLRQNHGGQNHKQDPATAVLERADFAMGHIPVASPLRRISCGKIGSDYWSPLPLEPKGRLDKGEMRPSEGRPASQEMQQRGGLRRLRQVCLRCSAGMAYKIRL